MDTPTGGRDNKFNLNFDMNLISADTGSEIFANNNNNISTGNLVQQYSPINRHHSSTNRANIKSEICFDDSTALDSCSVTEMNASNDSFNSTLHHHHHHHYQTRLQEQQQQEQQQQSQHHLHQQLHHAQQSQQQQEHSVETSPLEKSQPSNGKKTKGRVKIKMEYIENKLRRYTTFSKRKTGIMKKAYELSTLTGTQVMLLVASETGHVYTFATRKLQPMITSDAGKALIQTCLNSPDPPGGSVSGNSSIGDQRMSATGFEETELTYNITDNESKVRQLVYGNSPHSVSSNTSVTHTHSSQNTNIQHHYSHLDHLSGLGSPQFSQPCPPQSPLTQTHHQNFTHIPHSHMSHSHPQR